jgi:hypothetical protein
MTTPNPYESPVQLSHSHRENSRMMWSSVAVVFISAILGGLIGLGLGTAIGTLFPDYYRTVFSGGDSPSFNPLAVGMAQGLTQGTFGGGLIGVALVALYYWYRLRLAAQKSS